MNLATLFKALQAGQELKNPEKWKKGQNLINLVSALLAGIIAAARLAGLDIPMTDEQLIEVATIVAGVLALINGYLTTATTQKIGVK